ncbi:MAG: alpha/beta hydrolase [Planctomycetes bacterium]|nr:alpha/beta hydrolase [Planctomycetota bacterium]
MPDLARRLYRGLLAFCAMGTAGCQTPAVVVHDQSDAVVTASHDEPESHVETLPFTRSSRRDFPAQGWWCRDFEAWLKPERAEHGYAIVLPGIEGTSFHNISIARGLVAGGFDGAVEVCDWTTGHWPCMAYHLMALERNRAVAREIATQIMAYQDQYPGRPVALIGHSGGGAMSVLVLEALPEDRKVSRVILLAAAISPDYDLTRALSRTESGIVNFHSWGDIPHLVVGTLALGTIDREHSVSAGASGFHIPSELSEDARQLYADRLHQIPYRLEMARSFNAGGHIGPTNKAFVSEWVAPLLAKAGDESADRQQ